MPLLHWTPKRKTELLLKLHLGQLKEDDVCKDYGFSREELEEMKRKFTKAGTDGLKNKYVKALRRFP